MTDSPLIPNSYQMPNKYCDQFMYLLTPAEWKVLSYAARRIFGFQKRQDRISLSQFVRGTISRKDGLPLDHGTGLSKPTVIACLDSLIKYRLLIRLAPAENNPRKEDGDLYALQLDYDSVDYPGLVERANSLVKGNLLRTSPGRNQAMAKRLSIPLTGQSDLPVEPVNPIDHYRSIPLTTTGQSDLPQLVNPIDTQNQVGNKEETQRKGISHPDFDRACMILKASHPISLLTAGPVLLEADEKPYRLHVRLDSLPADFMQHLDSALRDANPRRHYRLTYETSGTGREAQAEAPTEEKPDPYSPTSEHLLLWQSILSELSFDVQPNTRRAYIDPALPIAVNGNWTIAVPSVEWWRSILYPSVKRIYRKLTGEVTDFVFVEMSK